MLWLWHCPRRLVVRWRLRRRRGISTDTDLPFRSGGSDSELLANHFALITIHPGLMVVDVLDVPGEWTYLFTASPQTVSTTHRALQPNGRRCSRCNDHSPVSSSHSFCTLCSTPSCPVCTYSNSARLTRPTPDLVPTDTGSKGVLMTSPVPTRNKT